MEVSFCAPHENAVITLLLTRTRRRRLSFKTRMRRERRGAFVPLVKSMRACAAAYKG